MFLLSFSENYPDKAKVEQFISTVDNGGSVELQTSGSTGNPKLLSYSTSILKKSARKTNAFFNFNKKTKALLCLNPDTIAGKMMLTRAHEGNYSIHVTAPSKRPLKFFEMTLDFIALVPLQLKESLIYDLKKLREVKTILVGGGPISKELEELLYKNKITVYHSFGMTETVSHVALRKVGYHQEDYFKALSGIHFSSQAGQLIIHAPELEIDELITNDLVDLNSEKTFKWLGRKDFVINTGSYKIHPELLENSWSKFLDCPFFLWKEPSVKWGEKMVMYLNDSTWPDFNKTDLMLTFKPYELPKTYYLCEEFVYTESGKINRPATVLSNPSDSREETL